MHFRARRNVVQLVRTTYDDIGKKPKASVVGRIRLDRPVISEELRTALTENELREAQAWIEGNCRTQMLREELAALTLPETLALANGWFARNKDSPAAAAAAASLAGGLQALRRTLKSAGFIG
ncbi:MAG TPA: hypothetical protein VJM11_08335 [Nevskiaceae bacterium]|nr:hypothetical protein [Nevskiaceae bacterium]